jgi:site-specific DNA-cytosine methylase
MNVLELFAGSRSVGKASEKLGFNVFSSDINDFDGIDYVVDILDFDISKVPFQPDIIWASPPCTTYSIAAISHHRPTGK